MSELTSKISDLNKKLADVEEEIILCQSRADEYPFMILDLQRQFKCANNAVLEVKDKKRQILNEISALISLDLNQAEIIIDPDIFNRPIEYLGLKPAAENCCRASGLTFIGDLVQLTELQLSDIPNLGKVTLGNIRYVLEEHDLKLNTKIENWIRPVTDVK